MIYGDLYAAIHCTRQVVPRRLRGAGLMLLLLFVQAGLAGKFPGDVRRFHLLSQAELSACNISAPCTNARPIPPFGYIKTHT